MSAHIVPAFLMAARRPILAVVALVLSIATPAFLYAEFVPPTIEQARKALGALGAESVPIQRLLEPDSDFEPIEAPQSNDWLADFDEPGQSFYDFVSGDARRATDGRKIIYLQPLGEFHADSSPALEALRDYAEAFFQLDVALLPAEQVESAAFEPRLHPASGKLQHRTTAILTWLQQRLPDDAFCLIAVTMTDLYPAPHWNFVYGQASPSQRTGVFSFARNDPAFFGQERPDDIDALILRRSCKTLVHEIAHLFGLAHCIYFRCVENGVNHQAESDSRPHHLCPVCLRKIQYATGADLGQRYRDLLYFFSNHTGWDDEEAWVRRQLAKLRASAAPRVMEPPHFDRREPVPPPPPAPRVPIPTAPTPDIPAAPAPAPVPAAPPQSSPESSVPAITPPTTASDQLIART